MARLTSDFYVVLWQALVSFFFFPVLVAMDANVDYWKQKNHCRLVAAFSHFALLSNALWMMNLSIQFYIRLQHYVYRRTSARFFYSLCGWALPCVAFAILNEEYHDNRNLHSCLALHSSAIYMFIHTLALLVAMVTVLVYLYDYKMLTELIKVFNGPEEKILCRKLESSMILHVIIICGRCVQTAVAITDSSVELKYVLACLIFIEGSVFFLGFLATNQEILIVLRLRYFEKSEEFRQALEDFETEDKERLNIQKETLSSVLHAKCGCLDLRLRQSKVSVVEVDCGSTMQAFDQGHNIKDAKTQEIVLEDILD
ncbi:adhesion G protein-coupled receptor B1-like [Ptychodera flava]|uniref:adhesion G protein-coupled receptor B1-like n=1 Tax=Ptychodera flava TaxID=63121 RepID=UPI00396AA16E